MTTLSQHT